MQVELIPLKRIRLSDSRPTVPETVNALVNSIDELGLIQPITVRKAPVMDGGVSVSGYEVVAGNHRVAAVRALGKEVIEAFVLVDEDRWDQEMREIDENLIRAELTAAQRASAIKRRKALWEQRHGEPKETGGTTCPTSLKDGRKAGPQHERQFASDTAERTGQSKKDINRHVSRAEALGDDLEAVTGTSLDKGVELDALKKLAPEERKPLIERAQAGEAVSARQALEQAPPTPAPSEPEPAPEGEEALLPPAVDPSVKLDPKPPAPVVDHRKAAFASMILDKLDVIERHLESQGVTLDDFESRFFDSYDAGGDALEARLRARLELMKSIGMIAATLE
ncbi:ParB N-terminal domain-containing protein [uncultured Halomonas sp.]|uniref:ParB/RepB/Spo0J family partition protein n=1 Tax=uncultured Halomonas sp. TaxID=173971 RepID=UPI00260CA5B0|nr:ParB N-terminal domain-containing protein [uncultured Halomonas sp.]